VRNEEKSYYLADKVKAEVALYVPTKALRQVLHSSLFIYTTSCCPFLAFILANPLTQRSWQLPPSHPPL
jgi:hypothetical protein